MDFGSHDRRNGYPAGTVEKADISVKQALLTDFSFFCIVVVLPQQRPAFV